MAGTYAKKPWSDGVSSLTALELDGIVATVGTPSVTIKEVDASGDVTYCVGATVPTNGDAGYAVGCTFKNTAGGSGTTLYINEGSSASASFKAVDTAGGVSVPLVLTAANSSNAVPLTATQSDTTNNPNAVAIANAGTGTALAISQTGNGAPISVQNSGNVAATISRTVAGVDGFNPVLFVQGAAADSRGVIWANAQNASAYAFLGINTAGGPALQAQSTSTKALSVSASGNGLTNPTLQVDASTASIATGLLVKGAAAGAGIALSAISSGTNESLSINGKGTGTTTFQSTTAVPAGGSAQASVLMSSTAALGVYFGSGAPTVSAAQGSLYVRTDGSSTSTRMYVNTNGTTGWTAVTTAT